MAFLTHLGKGLGASNPSLVLLPPVLHKERNGGCCSQTQCVHVRLRWPMGVSLVLSCLHFGRAQVVLCGANLQGECRTEDAAFPCPFLPHDRNPWIHVQGALLERRQCPSPSNFGFSRWAIGIGEISSALEKCFPVLYLEFPFGWLYIAGFKQAVEVTKALNQVLQLGPGEPNRTIFVMEHREGHCSLSRSI